MSAGCLGLVGGPHCPGLSPPPFPLGSQASIRLVKSLFRDQQSTEFVIATIPTVLGINESGRLVRALNKEHIPCKRIVVNQIIGPNMGDK